jgi:hypothetical protein
VSVDGRPSPPLPGIESEEIVIINEEPDV